MAHFGGDDTHGEGSARQSAHPWEAIADRTGAAYLRVSFTRHTAREVDALLDWLRLGPGMRVLDVGCGPGRHAVELARRGYEVVGVDIAESYLAVARAEAERAHVADRAVFRRLDARSLDTVGDLRSGFDAVISLCQGAFGSSPPDPDDPGHLLADRGVLAGIAAALRPGGRLALGGFSAPFQIRWLEEGDRYDVGRGVNHERTEVLDERRRGSEVDLWTTCYTPRELCLLAEAAGLHPEAVYSIGPGDYAPRSPDLDHPEFLLVAVAPGSVGG